MIIGREKEIEKLNELYASGSSELVALYGRRRVGKTFLVDQTFLGKITFRHAGLSPIDARYSASSARKSRMKDQLKHFYRSLTLQGMKKTKTPESWLDAFYLLEDFLQEKDDGKNRQLVFFDEIQWLDTPKSGFMTGFEAFWNGWACHRQNLMVIVCGSSSSWILDKVINNHGGLYDRVTYQIKLMPFTLSECERYFESNNIVMSRYDIAQSYMMVGGIPYYLKYFDRKLSLPQNIDSMFFTKNAPLIDEYDRLFSSLFVNPDVMKSIIEALGTKSMGLTRQELLTKTGIANSGEFSNQLKALISGSFIMKYCSFGNSKREEYYKLTDPFCLFYLHFVKAGDRKKITGWSSIADSGSVNAWRGYAFENICFNHIKQLKSALGISGVSTNETLWSKRGNEEEPGTQIDLIIVRKDNVVNMCEIKFCNDEFAVDKNYHFTLIRRGNLLKEIIPKRAFAHNTLITTYGLKRNEYYSDFTQVITLDDLFQE
ncbi:MAG: AAA family ATPase [Coriobacteriales bacterium]|nr:AAA family ATPase [Coriobacteriales bacterium]